MHVSEEHLGWSETDYTGIFHEVARLMNKD